MVAGNLHQELNLAMAIIHSMQRQLIRQAIKTLQILKLSKVDTNPGKVVITSVTDDNGDDALNGAYEGATKDNTPTINGFAEPYSTVTCQRKDSSGKVVWSGEVYVEDSLGDWSITVDKPLMMATILLKLVCKIYVKNPVQNSNVVSLTIDNATDKPVIKEIIDDVEGDTGDISSKNNWTKRQYPNTKRQC